MVRSQSLILGGGGGGVHLKHCVKVGAVLKGLPLQWSQPSSRLIVSAVIGQCGRDTAPYRRCTHTHSLIHGLAGWLSAQLDTWSQRVTCSSTPLPLHPLPICRFRIDRMACMEWDEQCVL